MLTQEQSDAVDAVLESDGRIVSVNSIAGSGKSHLAEAIAREVMPKNGLYTAFNRAIVQDSARKFGDVIECRTIHSLAYGCLRPKLEIKDLSYDDIDEDLDVFDKRLVINTINDFFLSRFTNFNDFFDDWTKLHSVDFSDLKHLCGKYIIKMDEGKVNPTFNFMLKSLHYDLSSGDVKIEKDLAVFDETQDVNAVSWEIFKLIESPKKVVLGDRFQNIYSFINTINVFDEIENDIKMRLTKSFRCNPDIASMVEDYGKRHLVDDFVFRGNPDIPKVSDTRVTLTRTNAQLIMQMYYNIQSGVPFSVIRNLNTIFSAPISILSAGAGKEVYDKEYRYLERLYREYSDTEKPKMGGFMQYLKQEIPNDINIMSAINLIESLKGVNLFDLKKKIANSEKDKNNIIATAHTYKGLEADMVNICSDLNDSLYKAMNGECDNPQEEKNLYYVAMSRAKNTLVGISC